MTTQCVIGGEETNTNTITIIYDKEKNQESSTKKNNISCLKILDLKDRSHPKLNKIKFSFKYRWSMKGNINAPKISTPKKSTLQFIGKKGDRMYSQALNNEYGYYITNKLIQFNDKTLNASFLSLSAKKTNKDKHPRGKFSGNIQITQLKKNKDDKEICQLFLKESE